MIAETVNYGYLINHDNDLDGSSYVRWPTPKTNKKGKLIQYSIKESWLENLRELNKNYNSKSNKLIDGGAPELRASGHMISREQAIDKLSERYLLPSFKIIGNKFHYNMIVDIDYIAPKGRVVLRFLIPYSLELDDTVGTLAYYWSTGITVDDPDSTIFDKYNKVISDRKIDSMGEIKTEGFVASEFQRVHPDTIYLKLELTEDMLAKFAVKDILDSRDESIVDMMAKNLGFYSSDLLLKTLKAEVNTSI